MATNKPHRELDYLAAHLAIDQRRQEREGLALMLQHRQMIAMERIAAALETIIAAAAAPAAAPDTTTGTTEPERCPIHDLPVDEMLTCEMCRKELTPTTVARFPGR